MQLLLIRHGQSEADILDVHEGRADFPLTALGEAQARKMAHYVGTYFPPRIILSSPLLRAKSTALILKEQVGCDVVIENELMEYNNGVLAGLSRREAENEYPLPNGGRPIHLPILGGESDLEFRHRADKIFHKITYEYKGFNRIAIVSHGGLISNFLKAFLIQPNSKGFAFSTGDTGIHLLEIQDDLRLVKFLNRQEHLLT